MSLIANAHIAESDNSIKPTATESTLPALSQHSTADVTTALAASDASSVSGAAAVMKTIDGGAHGGLQITSGDNTIAGGTQTENTGDTVPPTLAAVKLAEQNEGKAGAQESNAPEAIKISSGPNGSEKATMTFGQSKDTASVLYAKDDNDSGYTLNEVKIDFNSGAAKGEKDDALYDSKGRMVSETRTDTKDNSETFYSDGTIVESGPDADTHFTSNKTGSFNLPDRAQASAQSTSSQADTGKSGAADSTSQSPSYDTGSAQSGAAAAAPDTEEASSSGAIDKNKSTQDGGSDYHQETESVAINDNGQPAMGILTQSVKDDAAASDASNPDGRFTVTNSSQINPDGTITNVSMTDFGSAEPPIIDLTTSPY